MNQNTILLQPVMKTRILVVALLSVWVIGCKPKVKDGVSTELIDPKNPPVMTFKDTVFDFGTITQGQKVNYTYEFTNTGGSSLVINDVVPTCGCTVPQSWPRYPVKPGATGKIDVEFNSEGKSGETMRHVKIVSNAKPGRRALVIKGNIVAPKTN